MEIKQKPQSGVRGIKFTVEDSGKVIGWGFLFIIKNDRHLEPYGLVENVYIVKEYRGKGYGTRLINAIIQEAKSQGCYKLIGESRYSREKVHKLYQGLGFRDHAKLFRMDLLDSKPIQED